MMDDDTILNAGPDDYERLGGEDTTDLKQEIEELNNRMDDLAAAKGIVDMAMREMQQAIAELKIDKLATIDPPSGFDFHTPTEEEQECLGGGGDSPSDWAFGVSLVSATQVDIQAGNIGVIGSSVKWAVDKLSGFDISGSEYSYVSVSGEFNAGFAPEFVVTSAYPVQTGSKWYKPLARFKSSGGVYSTDGDGWILHRGDFQLNAPVAWA